MKRGFTLIEILVAVTIFVIVITVVSSLFVQAIRDQRRNLAYQELLDQTSYAMEYMSRSIRMAKRDDSTCTGTSGLNYTTNAGCLGFKNYKNECQYFCLVGAKLVTATTTAGWPLTSTDLTSPGLAVSYFSITDHGWGPDNLQPLVTISLEIRGREQSNIQIQTSISQRNLDR